MAVDAIRLQNFMAFEDTDWIELRPITLLFGRNSSGKSAIIKALLLLRQSLNAEPGKSQLLFLDPEGYDFGDFNSMLHQAEDLSRWRNDEEEDVLAGEITFGFRCSLTEEEFTKYLDTVLTVMKREFGKTFERVRNLENSYDLFLTFRFHKPPELTNYIAVLSDIRILCPWIQSENEPQVLFEANNLFYANPVSDLNEQWHFNTEILYEHQLEGKQDLWTLHEVDSISGFLPVLMKNGVPVATADKIKGDVDCASSLLKKLGDEIKQFLKSINHIRPLRPEPRRVYALDEGEKKKWEKRGWEYFLKFLSEDLDEPESTEINTWLQELGLAAKAIVGKSSPRLRDSVYAQLSLRELEKKKIKKDDEIQEERNRQKDGYPGFNIIDVGFGASQVLPIIIHCVLADPDAFIIIEQPELHLHPRAQAQLSDLFVSGAVGNVNFILETHSEHLFLRLRRWVAETTFWAKKPSKSDKDTNEQEPMAAASPRDRLPVNETQHLHVDDFRAYFVERSGIASRADVIGIDEYGELTEIPDGYEDFFADDLIEGAALARIRIEEEAETESDENKEDDEHHD